MLYIIYIISYAIYQDLNFNMQKELDFDYS